MAYRDAVRLKRNKCKETCAKNEEQVPEGSTFRAAVGAKEEEHHGQDTEVKIPMPAGRERMGLHPPTAQDMRHRIQSGTYSKTALVVTYTNDRVPCTNLGVPCHHGRRPRQVRPPRSVQRHARHAPHGYPLAHAHPSTASRGRGRRDAQHTQHGARAAWSSLGLHPPHHPHAHPTAVPHVTVCAAITRACGLTEPPSTTVCA
jgi:hypothetical protein